MASPLGGQPQPPINEGRDPYRFTTTWAGWFSLAHQILLSVSTSGTTAQRPTVGLWVGRRYFDTTLGIPIWVKSFSPTVWVNAAGAPV